MRATDIQLVRQANRLGDPEAGLTAIAELRRRLAALEAAHVDDALKAGWSWARVAMELGLTKQAAHARHARRRRQRERLVITGRARAAVNSARREAAALGADRTETDHVLLGLITVAAGPVADALAACGLTAETVRDRLPSRLPAIGGRPPRRRPSPVSPAAYALFEESLREAVARGDPRLDCEHLLLAMLHEPGGRAQRLIMQLGRSPRAVERLLTRALRSAAARSAQDAAA